MNRTRQTRLVVVDSSGSVSGMIGPVEVSPPWWQDATGITNVLPGAVVIRLLEAEPEPSASGGGAVTYLVQHDGPIPAGLAVAEWDGQLVDHELRLPWASIGGPDDDLAWVATVVDVDPSRPPVQHRTWNLSAIWSVPVRPSDSNREAGPASGEPVFEDAVWLKGVPPFFAHEAGVLDVMADQAIPRLLAHDRHRLLLAEMGGVDGYEPSPSDELAMIDALVDIQLAAVDRVDRLVAAGVPDLRTQRLVAQLTELVHRVAPNDGAVTAFVDGLHDRLATVDAMGVPDTLVHGDPHGGNCRIRTTPPTWFDWGDAFIGNPLLDLATTHRMSPPTVDHWLGRWQAELGDSVDLRRSWRLLQPVAILRMAWVYQRFCDNIEPAERIYHRDDVGLHLDALREWLSGKE